MDKVGLRPEVYKSGLFKDMLSGSRKPDEITPKEREMIQSLIDETYSKFTNVVAVGRSSAHDENKDGGKALSRDWANYADGRVLSGTEACKLGFVDELGNFDAAVKRAKAIAGIRGDANLVTFQVRYNLADLFRLFGQSESRVVKVDWGVEMPKLQVGQLYFLYLPMSDLR
jgi:protease-4